MRPNLTLHVVELGPCPGSPLSTGATLVIFVRKWLLFIVSLSIHPRSASADHPPWAHRESQELESLGPNSSYYTHQLCDVVTSPFKASVSPYR